MPRISLRIHDNPKIPRNQLWSTTVRRVMGGLQGMPRTAQIFGISWSRAMMARWRLSLRINSTVSRLMSLYPLIALYLACFPSGCSVSLALP